MIRILPFVAVLLLAACKPSSAPDDGRGQADAPPAGPAATPAPAAEPPAPRGNRDMPSLKLATIDGREYDLAAHRGKWVLVNFWATWCAPCLKEMPELSALDAMREHVEVIGLAYEDKTPAELQAFLREHPVVYPVAIVDMDAPPADFDTPVGLPMSYLIAPDGKVAKKFLGPVTAAEVEQAIAAAGGPAVPTAAGGA